MSLPELISDPQEMHRWTRQQQAAGFTVGVVPTMGALHEGHLSLAHAAREQCDKVVVTIFVNPTQFGPDEDFDRYPRDLDSDRQRLAEASVDVVFSPETRAVYPEGCTASVSPPDVSLPLEGDFRPGHFGGVCTVVLKLFLMIPAERAFFGQKDFQQALVIRQMVNDLSIPIEIQVCPIIREPDGLAMSSRNAYLSQMERQRALSLQRALKRVSAALSAGERSQTTLQEVMQEELAGETDRLDYAVVADPQTLECNPIVSLPAVALIAAHVGSTRLIDNCYFPANLET